MKILHLNTSDSQGGAARAAYRIHQSLLDQDINSYVYVRARTESLPNVLYETSATVIHKIGKKLKYISATYLDTVIFKLCRQRQQTPISFCCLSSLHQNSIRAIAPDIIHLHWICGQFVSIRDMKFLSQYKLVWTLHDSWPFTGGCHIPYACEKYKHNCSNCEQIGKAFGIDVSKTVFSAKEKYYLPAPIHIVAPSNWMGACARQSFLFRDKPISVIQNPINIDRFHPIPKETARNILHIPANKKLILFGAMNAASDQNKGFLFLYNAIQVLHTSWDGSDDIELMVFGTWQPDDAPDFGYRTTYMGHLHDDIALALLYAAADVMVVPSKSENFPNTILEAMSCGTPCVAFRIGGIPDQIDHLENGYMAELYSSEDLATGIRFVLEDEERRRLLSANARKKVVDCFREDIVAQKYIALYESILHGEE